MTDDYHQLLRDAILHDPAFVRATFSGAQKGHDAPPYLKITIRPVVLRGRRHWQFSYFDGVKDITKNYEAQDAAPQLESVFALPYRHFAVQTTLSDTQITLSKKGKPLISTRRLDAPRLLETAHDRPKSKPADTDSAAPYLQAVGIMTPDGRIRADMTRKYAQINQFLELVAPELDKLTPPLYERSEMERELGGEVNLVDLGCGSGYLTFAVYHHLRFVRDRRVRMVGVDVKTDLMAGLGEKAARLGEGWEGLTFEAGTIADYTPTTPPDVVIALHACDTATDDAIARGIHWGSRVIVTAPCCHHHLQAQMSQVETPPAFDPVLRHGILFERMGDLLTDSFRALLLRIMGYRAEVVQFVDTEHTPRNLMIRAVKVAEPGDPRFLAEYQALKSLWNVTPYLEHLLPYELLERK